MVKSRGHSGFTLTELMIGIAIMSVVMIGAFTVVTGTMESQNKLEKIISKGFTHLNYSGKGFPLHPPTLSYINRPGWFRIASSAAKNPQTNQVAGSLVTNQVNFIVSSSDLGVDTPAWTTCTGDASIRVTCSPFQNGQATITAELNTLKVPPAAIFRVRAEWPSLPKNHPNKYSPEYVITIPYVLDCELAPLTPGADKYLEHTGRFRESTPPEINGKCEPKWTNYTCTNGVLTSQPFTKVCPDEK